MAANTVKSLSERILRVLNLGDVPTETRFTLRDIDYMVRDSLGRQIAASWFASRNAGENKDIADSFITTITRNLQDEEGNNFVDLDFDWVDLPDDSGLQSVRPSMQGLLPDLSAFIPTPARFADLYKGLPAGALEGQVGWSNRGKRIYFSKKEGKSLIELNVTSVDIDAISTSASVLSENKPLPIPPNVAFAIILEVSQFFMPLTQGQKDMLFDLSSNPKPLAS